MACWPSVERAGGRSPIATCMVRRPVSGGSGPYRAALGARSPRSYRRQQGRRSRGGKTSGRGGEAVTDLSPDLVNGFARGIVRQFTLTAKGLDPASRRFIAARPYERILTGFFTPVGMGEGEDSSDPEGDGIPEMPADDSYEQTKIGFEWSVPIASVQAGMRIQVSVGL